MKEMRVQKKPIVVKAFQTDRKMIIHTLEGDMTAQPGDYVITGLRGEQYPCKADIFHATYDVVPEDTPLTPSVRTGNE